MGCQICGYDVVKEEGAVFVTKYNDWLHEECFQMYDEDGWEIEEIYASQGG